MLTRLAVDSSHRRSAPGARGEPDDPWDESAGNLIVHQHGNWFCLRGEIPVDLRHRGPLRRLLARLVDCHGADDESGCTVEVLVEAGWPDEVLTGKSGKNRVYSSVRMLRNLGLGDALATGDAGYHLAAEEGLAVTSLPFEEFEETRPANEPTA
ncbi:MAG: hypothetical protein ABEN55_23915 [Bradymonadaceae bacterium]